MDRRMTSCIRTIRLLRDISRSLLSFAGVFSLDWRCGGLSVVPSGLSLLSFGTQHFVLGGFQSSLRDFLCFRLVPSTSCWAIFGRPFGTCCSSWSSYPLWVCFLGLRCGGFQSSLRDFLCFSSGTQHFVLG